MTEEDTFRVLSQRPFEEVKLIALKAIQNMETVEEAGSFLAQFGWTFNEFETRVMQELLK